MGVHLKVSIRDTFQMDRVIRCFDYKYNACSITIHVHVFEFRLVCVAFLLSFGIFILMYHINKTEITSLPGDHSPSGH